MNILMIVSGDYKKDPRVAREKESLEERDFNVDVIDWKRNPSSKRLMILKMFLWWIKAIRQGLKKDFDVVHCHDFDTLIVGVFLKRIKGCKLVYDVHEMYALMTNIWLVLPFERLLVSNVDVCIAVHEEVEEYLKEMGAKEIRIVRNCKPILMSNYICPPNNGNFVVSYFGTLSNLRMFPGLIDAIGGLPDVRFMVGGHGPCFHQVQERCGQYDNVDFYGWITEGEVFNKILESDMVLCILNPDNQNCKLGTPNKLYECLAAGRPLMVTRGTSLAHTVRELKCGVAVGYDKDSIRKKITDVRNQKELCEVLGQNALFYGLEKYNWDNEKEKLIEVYGGMG